MVLSYVLFNRTIWALSPVFRPSVQKLRQKQTWSGSRRCRWTQCSQSTLTPSPICTFVSRAHKPQQGHVVISLRAAWGHQAGLCNDSRLFALWKRVNTNRKETETSTTMVNKHQVIGLWFSFLCFLPVLPCCFTANLALYIKFFLL